MLYYLLFYCNVIDKLLITSILFSDLLFWQYQYCQLFKRIFKLHSQPTQLSTILLIINIEDSAIFIQQQSYFSLCKATASVATPALKTIQAESQNLLTTNSFRRPGEVCWVLRIFPEVPTHAVVDQKLKLKNVVQYKFGESFIVEKPNYGK
ncbi:Hypothetical_protein [Hexamita inflata]|uniref:Hypothetical_protein n=1 Tax=Hexamita inflata TaxID=28002 RepID=A0ABP1JI42_9EUKA